MLSHRLPFWADMLSLLRDVWLSFCPAAVRRSHPSESTERTLDAAKITGLLQALVFAVLLIVHYAAFMRQRMLHFYPVLGQTAPVIQSGALVLLTFDFLIHPISLLLIYLLVEGALRFLGGVFFGEIIPSLPVFLAFKLKSYRPGKPQAVIEDAFENLPVGERVKIASAHPKPGWNATITIDIDGQWYEVEKEDRGLPPRSHIYLLRPAPPSKILRKYERYILPAGFQSTNTESSRTVTELQS
jgi:hypothetical protein